VGLSLWYICRDARLLDPTTRFRNSHTGEVQSTNAWFIMQWLGYYHTLLWAMFLLAFCMLWVVLAFFGHHLYLALTYSTTNERHKRGELDGSPTPCVEGETASQIVLRLACKANNTYRLRSCRDNANEVLHPRLLRQQQQTTKRKKKKFPTKKHK
jgi:hypothetical protein